VNGGIRVIDWRYLQKAVFNPRILAPALFWGLLGYVGIGGCSAAAGMAKGESGIQMASFFGGLTGLVLGAVISGAQYVVDELRRLPGRNSYGPDGEGGTSA
jgi:hypothetical protein